MIFPQYTNKVPDGTLERNIRLSEGETDENGHMLLRKLFSQMQTLTQKHFEKYAGLDVETEDKMGVACVVAWCQLEILRMPQAGEIIRERIWPGQSKSLLHSRKFAFYTNAGEPLLTASVYCVMMDRRTHKAVQAPAILSSMESVAVPGEPMDPVTLMKMPEHLPHRQAHRVCAVETDEEGQVNPACCLDWIQEIPGEGYLREHVPRKFWIEYSGEIRRGDTIALEYERWNDIMYVRGIHGEKKVFSAKVEYDTWEYRFSQNSARKGLMN